MIYEKHKRFIIPFDDVPSPRAKMPEISVEERRGNFAEVETGFPEEIAVEEAKRCLSCRRCLGCALCWAECKPEAIDFNIPDEELELEFDDVILTSGQDNAFSEFNPDLGFGSYADVITDLQFERMLSPTGPTDGFIMSPRDGEVPEKIAILQGNPDDVDDEHLLTSVIYGINESILALDKTEGLKVTLVSPLSQSFKDRFLTEAGKISGLQIIEGNPLSAEREKEGGGLRVTFKADGNSNSRKDVFDLVVVLTKPKPSNDMLALGKGLELDII